MTSKIEISHRTIIFTVLLLIGLWLLIQIRDILFLLFISFILMTALRPMVEALVRVRLPRVVAILLIYIVVFGLFGLSIAGAIPSLISQSSKFLQQLPIFIARIMPYWDVDIPSLTQQIAPIGNNVLKVTIGVFTNVISTFTVLVFTFYFLLERRHTDQFLTNIMGKDAADQAITVMRTIEQRLGAWVRGQLFLMVFVGVISYIGLTVLHVDFALPLAIIAGVLELVPMIGPTISAIPAILVAFTVSPFLALSVVALYFVIQQIENSILVPIVMRRSVGLSPLVTIIALMIGGRLAGVVGAVLAVPIVLVLQIILGALLLKSSK